MPHFIPAALIPWHRPCPGSAHCSCLRSWAPRHHCHWECPWKLCSSNLFNVWSTKQDYSRCKNWLSKCPTCWNTYQSWLRHFPGTCSGLHLLCPENEKVLISTDMKSWKSHLIGPAKVHVTADAFCVAKLLNGLLTNSTWAADSRRGALWPVLTILGGQVVKIGRVQRWIFLKNDYFCTYRHPDLKTWAQEDKSSENSFLKVSPITRKYSPLQYIP